MLQATTRFLTDREESSGDGWQVSLGDESAAPTVTYHNTLTAAQAAILAAFQSDAAIVGYFTQAAEASVLTAEAAAVTSAKAALLTAEGL
jgi:hypothetical protein